MCTHYAFHARWLPQVVLAGNILSINARSWDFQKAPWTSSLEAALKIVKYPKGRRCKNFRKWGGCFPRIMLVSKANRSSQMDPMPSTVLASKTRLTRQVFVLYTGWQRTMRKRADFLIHTKAHNTRVQGGESSKATNFLNLFEALHIRLTALIHIQNIDHEGLAVLSHATLTNQFLMSFCGIKKPTYT